MITNNPRLTDVGSEANRQRARQAGRQQAVLARMALAALQSQRPAARRQRWIRALQHRINNPGVGRTRSDHDAADDQTRVRGAAAARAARRWHHCRRQPNHCRGGVVMIKRLIGRAAVWAGRRRPGEPARAGEDPCVEREIAASLTDEALAWAVGTWSKRYYL